MNACPNYGVLKRLLADELAGAERETLEDHLAHCAGCQAELDRLARDSDSAWPIRPDAVPQAAPASDPLLWRRVAALGAAVLDSESTLDPNRAHIADTEVVSVAVAAPLPALPGYEILGEVGRGGMAVVYRARQLSLGRIVALKVVRGGPQASDKERSMLRAEAQAIATLEHAHIVRIYEVGEYQGQLYLSLEYLAGGSLARRLADAPQPPRPAASLMATLARAVQFAHARGVVHRDLKPANVLLACAADAPVAECVAKIADFGLAKRLDSEASLFTTADIVGTPSYIAPEQVRGKAGQVGAAADIYALGAMLYECLTGRPPFRAATAYETLLQVVHQEPVPPRQLQPSIPRDLETICLKCLHKEPRRRYASAQALADDLERFVAGQPIQARPVGALERAAKWVRRRPGLAGLLALVGFLTVAAFGLLLQERDDAEARARAEGDAKVAAEARARAEGEAKTAADERARQEKDAREAMERLTEDLVFDRANILCERGDVAAGLLTFVHGLELAERAGDAARVRSVRVNLAAWEGRLVHQRARLPHKSLVWTVAYAPGGDLVATAGNDGVARLWDGATGKPHGEPLRHRAGVLCVAFSPDGTRLLTGATDRMITLWEVGSGRELKRWQSKARVYSLRFVSASARFVSLGRLPNRPVCDLWDMTADERVADLQAHEPIVSVAVSPDGRRIVTGGANGIVRRWDADGRPPTGTVLVGHNVGGLGIDAVAISPDGKTVAAASNIGVPGVKPVAGQPRPGLPLAKVSLWDAESGTLRKTMLRQSGRILQLAFSPDSRLLATGGVAQEWDAEARHQVHGQGETRIFETATGRRLGRPFVHAMAVLSLAFSPDGRLLLIGCEDGKAHLYSVAAGEPLSDPMGHNGAVMSLAFSPDGRTAVTGSAGGDDIHGTAARLCVLPTGAAPRWWVSLKHVNADRSASSLAFDADDRTLLTARAGDAVPRRWDLATGAAAKPLGTSDPVLDYAVDRTGHLLAASCRDKTVRIWDRATGRQRHVLPVENYAYWPTFSPDGRRLMVELGGGTVQIWDTATGKRLGDYPHEGTIPALAFVTAERAVWLEYHDDRPNRLWQWTPAEGERRLWEQPLNSYIANFSADGRVLLVAGNQRFPRLYDTQTGKPLGPALPAQPDLVTLRLAPDGRTAYIASLNGTVRPWDMLLARPLGPPLRHRGPVINVAIAADARTLATADVEAAYLWTVPPPLDGSAQELRQRMEQRTGMTIDEQGVVRELAGASQ